jgi:hypothetical protein
LAIRTARVPSLKGDIYIALFGIFLFFCHIIVLGFASLVALGYVWGTHYRELRALVRRTLPYLAPVPIIVVWLIVTYNSEARAQSDSISFGSLAYRAMQLVVQPAGREEFTLAPITVLLVTGSILLLPWLAGGSFSRRPERWLPFALGLSAFLVLPHYVFSAAYFYQRLGVFLTPLWFMAWDSPQRRRNVDLVAMAVVVFWVMTSIGRFAAFAKEVNSFRTITAGMEPGRHAAAMVFDNRSPLFGLPVYLHFPVWYQATRGGIVDFNFADLYTQMARYRPEVGPRISEALSWHPTAFSWDRDGGKEYVYFLVKANFDISNEIFKEKRNAVELVAQEQSWWLYRNRESQVAAISQ